MNDRQNWKAMFRSYLELLDILSKKDLISVNEALYLTHVLRSPIPLDRESELDQLRRQYPEN